MRLDLLVVSVFGVVGVRRPLFGHYLCVAFSVWIKNNYFWAEVLLRLFLINRRSDENINQILSLMCIHRDWKILSYDQTVRHWDDWTLPNEPWVESNRVERSGWGQRSKGRIRGIQMPDKRYISALPSSYWVICITANAIRLENCVLSDAKL